MGAPLLFLSANTPWVFALANAVARHRAATAIRFYDVLTWRRQRPRWPDGTDPGLHKVIAVMPPGYAGRFAGAFRPLMRGIVDAQRRRLRRIGGEPYVVVPYPYLEPWVAAVPDARLIYYSLDEYAFYDPPRAAQMHAQEDRLVARAARTICLSAWQADVLRRRHPGRAADILHFPLGVEADFVNPAPATPPLPATIGYVGNLGDRVDWAFVAAVARHAPGLRFEFVGALGQATGDGTLLPEWEDQRDRAFALPNVHHLGSVPQEEVAGYYWRSAVNWMPYDIRHGFNLAACPTKIMDAIAAGRPFASTDVPECRLYPDLIHIADEPAAMAALLTDLAAAPRPAPATLTDYARTQSWPDRADTLLALLDA